MFVGSKLTLWYITEEENMNVEFLMIDEMKQKYPDEWLLITDCELNENTELESG